MPIGSAFLVLDKDTGRKRTIHWGKTLGLAPPAGFPRWGSGVAVASIADAWLMPVMLGG